VTTAVAEKPQHMVALARANEIRNARAAVKRQIKAGEVGAAEVLRTGIQPFMENMDVEELLTAIPHFSKSERRNLRHEVRYGELKTLGTLTTRQLALIVRRVGEWEKRARERAAEKAARRPYAA